MIWPLRLFTEAGSIVTDDLAIKLSGASVTGEPIALETARVKAFCAALLLWITKAGFASAIPVVSQAPSTLAAIMASEAIGLGEKITFHHLAGKVGGYFLALYDCAHGPHSAGTRLDYCQI
jgi:hypothetical protein